MIETWPAGADLRFTACEEMRSGWIASSTRMGDLLLGSQRTNATGADADRHDGSLGHGHAGIGLFLLELFRLTASSRFAEGANQAIERALELTAAKAASLGCPRAADADRGVEQVFDVPPTGALKN